MVATRMARARWRVRGLLMKASPLCTIGRATAECFLVFGGEERGDRCPRLQGAIGYAGHALFFSPPFKTVATVDLKSGRLKWVKDGGNTRGFFFRAGHFA
ncbi:hypothetical protein OF001_U10006 [Pseudomonas sp. OF001]|nr:hypothetical protein OF001_U10006 [Pseudomonas sp. OF001]